MIKRMQALAYAIKVCGGCRGDCIVAHMLIVLRVVPPALLGGDHPPFLEDTEERELEGVEVLHTVHLALLWGRTLPGLRLHGPHRDARR